jgi:hypothetical protein
MAGIRASVLARTARARRTERRAYAALPAGLANDYARVLPWRAAAACGDNERHDMRHDAPTGASIREDAGVPSTSQTILSA